MASVTAALSWYLVVQLLGCLAYLLIVRHCRALPDHGYASSKCLGVLLCGFLLWIGTSLGLLRNDPAGAALVVLLLAAVAAWQAFRATGPPAPRPTRHVVIASEALFAAAFAGWCFVRFANPAANHTEQPMDLMMLTAVAASPAFPPADPWLAGYPISYYYLGYWVMSAVGHLAGQPPVVSYNVGQACWFALLVTTVFGIGCNLVSAAGIKRASERAALAGGGLAVLAVTLASNLVLPLEWLSRQLQGTGPSPLAAHWWWWRSSRPVVDVAPDGQPIEIITEFPFFSYLLGDNHPHLLAMPFVALAISLGLALYLTAFSGRRDDPATRRSLLVLQALLVLTCAASIALNTWDVPAVFLLVVSTPALLATGPSNGASYSRELLRMLPAALLVVAVINVPYLMTAQSQVRGVLPNLFHPTDLAQFAAVFGTLAPGLLLLLLAAGATHRPATPHVARWFLAGACVSAVWLVAGAYWSVESHAGREWLARVAGNVDDPLSRSFQRWMAGWPVLMILLAGTSLTTTLLWSHAREAGRRTPGLLFALLLALAGFAVVLVPELVYAHDDFANRMNTVFKFYYQAWLFFGLAASSGIVLAWMRGGAARAGAAAALIVLAAGLIYAPLAVASVVRRSATAGTFDALDYIRRARPDEHAAIEWIRAHTRTGDLIVQAAGRSYDVRDSTISIATARPTLLGWEGHERQWRGRSFDAMAAGRHEALAAIYTPRSDEEIQRALSAWHVAFVYLGPAERARYAVSREHEARMSRAMDIVFEQRSVRIYRPRREKP